TIPTINSRAMVVGVVADARYKRLDEPPAPTMYLLYRQQVFGVMNLLIRGAGDSRALASQIRGVIRQLDPTQPVENFSTIDDVIATSVADRRFYALSTAGFALVGLLLAVAGLYGVVSRGVTEQVREIGVRAALGADRTALLAL